MLAPIAVVDILICIAIIALVVVQEGHDRGLGALGGSTMDTFLANSGRSKRKRNRKNNTNFNDRICHRHGRTLCFNFKN